MPSGCQTEDKLPFVDIGRCEESPCSSYMFDNNPPKCCVPLLHQQQTISCDDFSYDVSTVRRCGCEACKQDDDADIYIRGIVYVKDEHTSSQMSMKKNLIPINVKFEYKGNIYTTGYDGTFAFTISRKEKFVEIIFYCDENIPSIVNLPVHNLYEERYQIVLYKKPLDIVIGNPSQAQHIEAVEIFCGQKCANHSQVHLSLPSKSLMRGSFEVKESTEISVSYTRHIVPESVSSMTGLSDYVDDFGNTEPLLSYAHIWISSEDTRITGRVNLTFSMDIVEDPNLFSNESLQLWKRDQSSRKLFSYKLTCSRNESFECFVELDITDSVTYFSLARRVFPKDRCVLAVELFNDEYLVDKSDTPELMEIYTTSETRNYLSYRSFLTRPFEVTCLPVVCGLTHILKFSKEFSSNNFNEMPSNMNFKIDDNGINHIVTFDTDLRFDSDIGPLFYKQQRICGTNIPNEVMLKFGRISLPPQPLLHAIRDPIGGLLDWYTETQNKTYRVCVLPIVIYVSNIDTRNPIFTLTFEWTYLQLMKIFVHDFLN